MAKEVKLSINYELFCELVKKKDNLKKFGKKDASKLLGCTEQAINKRGKDATKIVYELEEMSRITGVPMDKFIKKTYKDD